MSTHNEEPLGDVIRQLLKVYGWESKLDEVKLINSWSKVMGKNIQQKTLDLHVEKKVLFVHLDSDALKHELSYGKSLIVKNLNEEAGKEVIREVVFR
ncbi:MAG: DUF721 domain-containing protein [Bacteroidales bacterium]|jgi:predicted nucleic acid-binding Zn ribbon protein|nr:DUF721 domain-containing protein [Bacteroidales bacterium]MDY0076504.1 DUF721 domain-containing protein [Bacteroidales bacterium]